VADARNERHVGATADWKVLREADQTKAARARRQIRRTTRRDDPLVLASASMPV
jgi:hypothetical protein